MKRKILIVLLVLALVTLLVAGCKKQQDTTLEGTWRVTEAVENGKKITYPVEEEFDITDGPTVKLQIDLYMQLEKGVIKSFQKYSYETKTWLILIMEGSYTVEGNTITVTYGVHKPMKTNYVITGNNLYLTEGEDKLTAVKVNDSEVAGDPLDYMTFMDELREYFEGIFNPD